jgi:putative ABC transport system permease protein
MSFWQDLRTAVRTLLKNPGFSAVIVLALALGLGVNTAVFGAVNVFLVRPLSTWQPARLTRIFSGPRGEPEVTNALSYLDFQRLRQDREVFADLAASTVEDFVISENAGPRRAGEHAEMSTGELVTAATFDLLHVAPQMGRSFTPADDRPGAEPTILLGHGLWQRRFAADPQIIGQRIHLNRGAFTVIGVLPADFTSVNALPNISCWVPLAMRSVVRNGEVDDFFTNGARRELRVLGRLASGITLRQAQERVASLGETMARDYPASNAGTRWAMTPEIEGRYGSAYQVIARSCALALFIAGLVVLISCANVANLLLARAGQRTREVGIRMALGAGRGRIIRQLLAESLLLALAGGGLGLLLAFWLGDLLHLILPPVEAQPEFKVVPDRVTLAWALGGAVAAGLVFGILPAWRASRASLVTALRSDLRTDGHSLRRPGLRHALVVAQLAISIMVVASGGLFFRSLDKLQTIDPGYRTENLVSALVDPGLFTDDQARIDAFFEQLQGRIERLPGVQSVSSSMYMALVNAGGACGPLIKDGDPPPPPNQTPPVLYTVVARRYFETMGTQLLFGRDFLPSEHKSDGAAVIINAELARRMFGRPEDAVGRRFRVGTLASPPVQIVGVARDGRYLNLLEGQRPWIFWPNHRPELHETNTMRTVVIRARSQRDAPIISERLRAEVEDLDARLPVMQMAIARSHLAASLYAPRMAAGLGIVLAVLALALATMGIYSLMTYTVSQRTREIGIRMALGGQATDVLRLVTGQGLWLIAAGVLLGAAGAAVVGRSLASLLYGVSPTDPVTFLATAILLVLVALLATLVPARRATRVDPMIALRQE